MVDVIINAPKKRAVIFIATLSQNNTYKVKIIHICNNHLFYTIEILKITIIIEYTKSNIILKKLDKLRFLNSLNNNFSFSITII